MASEKHERVDIIIDLRDGCAALDSAEHFSTLAAAGFAVRDVAECTEQELAQIDDLAYGSIGSSLYRRSAVFLERPVEHGGQPAHTIAGVLSYGHEFHTVARLSPAMFAGGDTVLIGPFAFDALSRELRLEALFGVLGLVRERGFRRAVIAGIHPDLLTLFHERIESTAIFVQPLRFVRPKAALFATKTGMGYLAAAVVGMQKQGGLELELSGIITDSTLADSVGIGERGDVPVTIVPWEKERGQTRAEFDMALTTAAGETGADLMLLLGWTFLVSGDFLTRFPNTLNMHGSYLPPDPAADIVTLPDGSRQPVIRGINPIVDGIQAGQAWGGCALHQVTNQTDRGRIMARRPLRFSQLTQRWEDAVEILIAFQSSVTGAGIMRWIEEQAYFPAD